MLSFSSDQFTTADWHLVLCKPNQTHIAFKHLSRLDIDLFMPQHDVERRWRGRVRMEQRPVFGGYIFFSTGTAQAAWRPVRMTPGVSQIIGFGQNGPARVPNEIIAGLMQRCDASGRLQPDQDFAIGDKVRITSGPFADFVSEIERIDEKQRIHVLLDLLGGHTRVALDPARLARQR